VSDSPSYFHAHIEIAPTASQQEALEATLQAFEAACDHVVHVGRTASTTSNMVLHQRCYQDIRRTYHLSANLAVRSIARAARRLKGASPLPHALRETTHYMRAAAGQSPELPAPESHDPASHDPGSHTEGSHTEGSHTEGSHTEESHTEESVPPKAASVKTVPQETEESPPDLPSIGYDARTLSIPSRDGASLSTVAGRMREIDIVATNRPFSSLVTQAVYRAALLRCTGPRYHVIIEFATHS